MNNKSIQQAIKQIKEALPSNVSLIAVSKTMPNASISEAYNGGQRDFGENKVQDLVKKYDDLPKDIRWHFIGHLQSNKVKFIVPFVHLIHGVDSASLLKEINKRAKNANKVVNILLQVHIAKEDSKYGFKKSEILNLHQEGFFTNLPNLCIIGLMGMSTLTTNKTQINEELKGLKEFFNLLSPFFSKDFKEISMGMSNDYKIAIEQGSTMVRIGSAIFGSRN